MLGPRGRADAAVAGVWSHSWRLTMRTRLIVVALALGVGVLLADLNYNVFAASGNERVAMIDDCDPEADWGPGGCLLRNGLVSMAEFRALLVSPLSPTTVVGHPSWRMDPGYLLVEEGDKVKVRNDGGRNHTFTKVAQLARACRRCRWDSFRRLSARGL